ncbi:MAG: histidine kinase, partial [Calditrichia bacterium]|nr:histidine kinase [Calditrichia bacterium]
MWIGTADGLCMYNSENKQFKHFNRLSEKPFSQNHNDVWALFEDNKENIWIGTHGKGLKLYNQSSGKFKEYFYDSQNRNSLSNNNIWCIYEDSRGNIWIGTSVGLNKFEPDSGKFIHYFEKDGLPNNCVYGILEDENGYLWLSTNGGLSRFNYFGKPGENFRNFDMKDGLQSNEFNMGAHLKCKNGMFLFGGIKGFNFFYPGKLKERECTSPVRITDLKILNREIPFDTAVHINKKLYLNYNQNSFSVEFALLDYANFTKNQYKYILEGLDENWNYSRNRHFANYTNLAPGKYKFIVKGANHEGVWSEKSAELDITIKSSIWGKWWFRGILVIVLMI